MFSFGVFSGSQMKGQEGVILREDAGLEKICQLLGVQTRSLSNSLTFKITVRFLDTYQLTIIEC